MGLSTPPQQSTTATLKLVPILQHTFKKPIFLTHPNNTSGQLFIVEQNGKIHIFENGQLLAHPFLNVSNLLSTGGERGLLGLAFHPNYKKNGRFFINYTRKLDRATIISEYHRGSNPNISAPKDKTLLVIPQPYGNHNGGMIAFGPDGFLYIGMGDGGAGGDPENRGQNPHELLGKILRLDVDSGSPYDIPSDNLFANTGGRPEIYAVGFRNPWRFSFDRKTGTLWVGDVGQNAWEEIAVVKNGENHGWRFMEGKHCFLPEDGCQSKTTLTPPVLEYSHSHDRCSVTGGYMYRGKKMPTLYGTYIFADFCTGEIFGYRNGKFSVILKTNLQIPSFGEDEDGELYALGYDGSIHQLNQDTPSPGPHQ